MGVGSAEWERKGGGVAVRRFERTVGGIIESG